MKWSLVKSGTDDEVMEARLEGCKTSELARAKERHQFRGFETKLRLCLNNVKDKS